LATSGSRLYARNALSALAQLATSVLTSVILVRLFIGRLGLAGNGAWVVVGTLGEILALFELGVGTAVVKFASEAHGRGDTTNVHAVLVAAFRFCILAAVLELGVAGTLAASLSSLFKIAAGQDGQASAAVLLVGLDVALSLGTSPYRLALQSVHRFDVINWLSLARMVVRFTVLAIGLHHFPSLVFVAAVGLVTGAATNAASVLFAVRSVPACRRWLRGDPVGQWPRRLMRYSIWVLVSMLSGRLAYSMDALVVAHFRGLADVTFYNGAWKLVELIRSVGQAVVPFFVPAASERQAQGRIETVPVIFYQGVRMVVVVTYPLCAIVLGVGDTLLALWLGPEFGRYYPILATLLVPQLAIMTVYSSLPIAYGLGRHRPLVLYGLAVSAVNLALSLALVRPLGLLGVALGTAISLSAAAIINLWVHPRLIGFDRRIYLRVVARGLAVVAPAIAALRLLRLANLGPWVELALASVVGVAVCGAFLAWELTPGERAGIRASIMVGGRG